MKKPLVFLIALFLISAVIAADGDYGAGTYGDGSYGSGTVTPTSSPSGGGGGGGGGGSCTEQWTCTAWSECSGGKQIRTCTETRCGTRLHQPETEKSCTETKPKTTTKETLEGAVSGTKEESSKEKGMEGITGMATGSEGQKGTTPKIFTSIISGIINIFKAIGRFFSWVF